MKPSTSRFHGFRFSVPGLVYFTAVLLSLLIPHAASASWSQDSTSTPVCTADDAQISPAICPDDFGGSFIVWADGRNGASEIFAQRLTSTGDPLWTLDGVLVATAPANFSGGPVVVADGVGGAVVAWEDLRTGNVDVYAQRLSPTGSRMWTASGVALCTATGNQFRLGIVPDGTTGATGAIVTWNDYRTGSPTIYARRVSAGGTAMWAANGVNLGLNAAEGGTVSDGAGGAIITGLGPSPTYPIGAQRINGAGLLQWGPTGAALPTGGVLFNGTIADGAGGVIVSFTVSGNAFAQRLNGSGSVQWSPASGVALTTLGQANEPQLSSDGGNGAIVAWSDSRSSSLRIYAQRVTGGGSVNWTVDGVPVCTLANAVSTTDTRLAITADGQGGAVIAWQDFRNELASGADFYAQLLNSSGQAQWTTNGRPVCKAPRAQQHHRMVPDACHGAVLVWEDQRNDLTGDSNEIYAQEISCQGNLGSLCSCPSGVVETRLAGTWLRQPSPNPTWGEARITLDLPDMGDVSLIVFDVAGRQVRTVASGPMNPGTHIEVWDGRDSSGHRVGAGIYLLRLEWNGVAVATERVVVAR